MCASASVEHVRQDLELMNVVQHCCNLVALRCVELMLLCWSSSLCKLSARLMCSASGERDDLSNLVLDAPGYGCSVDNPDNSLIESILLFKGLFQRHRVVRPILDRIASCASFNCGISIASELSGTALAASVLCCLLSVGQLESTSLFLNRIRDILIASSHLHLDCGTCLCVVT